MFKVFFRCFCLKLFETFWLLTKKLFSYVSCSFSCVVWLWESSSSSSSSIAHLQYLSLYILTDMEIVMKRLMVIGVLLEKRKKSCFLLLCWYSAKNRAVEHTLDCHIHFGAVVEVTGLPILNFCFYYRYCSTSSFTCSLKFCCFWF